MLPWITATAFLHSVMMQEKKGMMKVWNMVLVSATFFLCIFGTFLTRSGIVSSVHAFAQSSIGQWFVGFLAIAIAGTVYLILSRLDYLKTEARLESVLSRESSFLFNNLILLASCVRGSVGHAVSGDLGSGHRGEDHRRRAVLQPRQHPDRAVPAVPDRRGTAVRLAADVAGEPAPEFPVAGAGRGGAGDRAAGGGYAALRTR